MTKRIKAYLVGGAVRDRLLGIESNDLDYAVEASSYEEMVAWIRERGGKIFLEKPEYWTVRAQLPDKSAADYILCRKDGQYSDGRRPDSVEPGTLLDDLARRDFTVNAMAFDEDTNSYIDPFNGKKDLEMKWLECVGSAGDRFSEDALRMLRAIRFAITKDFDLSRSVHNALKHEPLLDKLRDNISLDRKRDELRKCFKHNTLLTLEILSIYDGISKACFQDGNLWLMPTSGQR